MPMLKSINEVALSGELGILVQAVVGHVVDGTILYGKYYATRTEKQRGFKA